MENIFFFRRGPTYSNKKNIPTELWYFYSTIVWEIARGTWIFCCASFHYYHLEYHINVSEKKDNDKHWGKLIFLFIIFFLPFRKMERNISICFVSTKYIHGMIILRLRLSWIWCDSNIKRRLKNVVCFCPTVDFYKRKTSMSVLCWHSFYTILIFRQCCLHFISFHFCSFR